MNPNFRNFALWIIIILLVVAAVMLFQNPGQRVPSQDIAFSQLLTEVDQGHVRAVTIAGNEITGLDSGSPNEIRNPLNEIRKKMGGMSADRQFGFRISLVIRHSSFSCCAWC